MSNYHRCNDREAKPLKQILLSLLVFALFFALSVDWEWFTRRTERVNANFVSPASIEGEQMIAEVQAIKASISQAASADILTITDTIKARNRVASLCIKMHMDCGDHTSFIVGTCKETYIKTWPLMSSGVTLEKWKHGDNSQVAEECRINMARSRFYFDFSLVEVNIKSPFQPGVSLAQWKAFGRWILKWYYLLTLPILLTILINAHCAGQSIRRKLTGQFNQIALAVCFGPIGLCFISETASMIAEFNCARSNYLYGKPIGFKLSSQEVNALWLQVFRPELGFAEAYEASKSESVCKPVLACLLIWLCGLTVVSAKPHSLRTAICIQTANEAVEANCEKTSLLLFAQQDLVIAPTCFRLVIERLSFKPIARTIWTVCRIFIHQKCPRGPPANAVRKNVIAIIIAFLLTALTERNQEKSNEENNRYYVRPVYL